MSKNNPLIFYALLDSEKIKRPVAEHKFHPDRKWRFDYAWIEEKLALEIEGAVWSNGRHTRGSGFVKDMEKYNAATLLGWSILRVVPSELCKAKTTDMLKKFLCR